MRVKFSGEELGGTAEGQKQAITWDIQWQPLLVILWGGGGGGGYVPFQVMCKDEGDIARDVITWTYRKEREDWNWSICFWYPKESQFWAAHR